MSNFQAEKQLVLNYFEDMHNAAPDEAIDVLKKYTSEDYVWECVYPFLEETNADYAARVFWKPFKESMKHIQRRQDVFIAGRATDGENWVMSMGHFMGLFDHEFLGIRPTCKMQNLQYTEFACIRNGKIVHAALFIDLIGFMVEAGVNPLPPETGHYYVYPGPKDHNGLHFGETDPARGEATMKIINDMLTGLYSATATSGATMRDSWAEDMIWYGPCGVGASYTIPRYQIQHQFPFRQELCDRESLGRNAFFAEGDFACFWNNLKMSSTGGWLGMAGGSKHNLLRADLDVYYCKDGKISENWCFFDIPYWLKQQGLDIFKRTAGVCNPDIQ